MKRISTVLMVLALLAAVLVAANMSPFPAGAVVCLLAAACLAGLASVRQPAESLPAGGWLVLAAGGCFVAGMMRSPVGDYARADAVLLAGGLLTYLWAASVGNASAQRRVLAWLALLGLVAVAVAVVQATGNPSFSPVYGERATTRYPSGLHGHYSYFANWLLGLLFPCLALGLDSAAAKRRWRLAWLAAALAMAGGIALSQSRGAVVGAAAGMMVWLVLWVSGLRRRFPAWRGVIALLAAVLVPLLAVAGVALARFVLTGRGVGLVEGAMTKDNGRLNFAKMAIEQAMDHPWTGAGSRSFSYELLHYWHLDELWNGSTDIVMVHNEFLQAAADYGWPALGLLVLLAGVLLFRALVLTSIRGKEGQGGADVALVVGTTAGAVAMLTQSYFDFVFHLLPNLMTLALLCGIVDRQPWPLSARTAATLGKRWVAAVVCGGLAIGAVAVAWRDAAAAWILGRQAVISSAGPPAAAVAQLEHAADWRPDHSLWRRIGNLRMSEATGADERTYVPNLEQATEAYHKTLARQPYDWVTVINLARIDDRLGQFDAAARLYQSVIPLTDCREPYYRARFFHGRHLYMRGFAAWNRGEREAAGTLMEQAREEITKSRRLAWFTADTPEGRVAATVDEMCGLARFNTAREAYAAAREVWSKRKPGQALTLAVRARDALRALRDSGAGQPQTDAAGLLPQVEEFIGFLEGAGIRPE